MWLTGWQRMRLRGGEATGAAAETISHSLTEPYLLLLSGQLLPELCDTFCDLRQRQTRVRRVDCTPTLHLREQVVQKEASDDYKQHMTSKGISSQQQPGSA